MKIPNGFVYTPRTYLLGALVIILIWKLATYGAVTVTLAWDASPTPDLDGYRLQMVDPNGNPLRVVEVTADQLEASMTDLVEGQAYAFVVVAYRGADQSPPSNLVSWTAPTPTPTPTPTPNPTATPTPILPPPNVHIVGAQPQAAPSRQKQAQQAQQAQQNDPTVKKVTPTATPRSK